MAEQHSSSDPKKASGSAASGKPAAQKSTKKSAKKSAKKAAPKTSTKSAKTAAKKAAPKTAGNSTGKSTGKTAGKTAPQTEAKASEAPKAAADKAGAKPQAAPAHDDYTLPDPAEFARNMMTVAQKSQTLLTDFIEHQRKTTEVSGPDPLNLGETFMTMLQKMSENPQQIVEAQMRFWQGHMNLWNTAWRRMLGEDVNPVVEPDRKDKRFRHPDWAQNQIFDFIKQSYLLSAQWAQDTVAEVQGLDAQTKRKVDFYTKQFVDALSPSNFLLTNPEVLKTTLASNGENLVRGLNNMLEDMQRGKGTLWIKQTDMDSFKVGENVATAPGKVMYQNELMQLLQFDPATEQVYERPLLIFPPWINKFYILDLREENSFIRWATAQGYTVFVASWVNPDERLARKSFEDYMKEGILEALDAVEQCTGMREVNCIGYCIGGTLLGASLAYMAAKGDDRIKSATFFAAQVDFSEAGDLQVFIDDKQIEAMQKAMEARGGYMDGVELANTFNMLRANDLIWSFVVNNYMLGKEPMPFDLLFWNSDQTRMPIAMHLFYLTQCYRENRLARKEMVLDGVRLDLNKVKIPIYLQSSRDDHIAPYNSVYKATQLYGGETRFICAGSGHIAGVINPPSANKYQYWTNESGLPDSVEDWWKGVTEHPGSWWPDWDAWLSKRSGKKVPARKPGDGKLKPIEDAPGSYVKVQSA